MKDHHKQYLERTARSLSRDLGRSVRPNEVLTWLVELAIEDEGIYDPEDGQVLSTNSRDAVQPEDGFPRRLRRLASSGA